MKYICHQFITEEGDFRKFSRKGKDKSFLPEIGDTLKKVTQRTGTCKEVRGKVILPIGG